MKTFKKLAVWGMIATCSNLANANRPVSLVDFGRAPHQVSSPVEPPANVSRGSKMIGMKILDPQSEYLGKIRDIVFDFKTGQVAYVVMAVNVMDIFAFREKYLAVPMGALDLGGGPTAFRDAVGEGED